MDAISAECQAAAPRNQSWPWWRRGCVRRRCGQSSASTTGDGAIEDSPTGAGEGSPTEFALGAASRCDSEARGDKHERSRIAFAVVAGRAVFLEHASRPAPDFVGAAKMSITLPSSLLSMKLADQYSDTAAKRALF